MKLSASPSALHPTGNLLHGKQNPVEWRTARPATHQKAENPLFFTFYILIKLHGSVGGICGEHWLISDLLSRRSSFSCVTLEILEMKVMRTHVRGNKTMIQIFTEKQWKNNKLTLVPASPRCPSGPFIKNRERTTSHKGSSFIHIKSTGKGASVHTDAIVHNDLSDAHGNIYKIAKMRQTHSYACGSGSPCFTFLTFAAMLSWVARISLGITKSVTLL